MSEAWTEAQGSGGFFETRPGQEDLENGLLKSECVCVCVSVCLCVLKGHRNVFNMPRDRLGEKSAKH